jgi:hypothetical protein
MRQITHHYTKMKTLFNRIYYNVVGGASPQPSPKEREQLSQEIMGTKKSGWFITSRSFPS